MRVSGAGGKTKEKKIKKNRNFVDQNSGGECSRINCPMAAATGVTSVAFVKTHLHCTYMALVPALLYLL